MEHLSTHPNDFRITEQQYKELQQRLETVENILFLGKEVLNLEEAAIFLGITKSSLYKMTDEQTIPFYRPRGDLVYFEKKDLLAWLRKNKIMSKEEVDLVANIILQKLGMK